MCMIMVTMIIIPSSSQRIVVEECVTAEGATLRWVFSEPRSDTFLVEDVHTSPSGDDILFEGFQADAAGVASFFRAHLESLKYGCWSTMNTMYIVYIIIYSMHKWVDGNEVRGARGGRHNDHLVRRIRMRRRRRKPDGSIGRMNGGTLELHRGVHNGVKFGLATPPYANTTTFEEKGDERVLEEVER